MLEHVTSNIHSHHIGQSGHEQCIYCNAKWGSGLRVRVMNDLNNFTTWCEYCKHQTSINMILHLHLREPKSTIISCVALSSVCSVCYVVSDIYCWCWYFCHGTTALHCTVLHCTDNISLKVKDCAVDICQTAVVVWPKLLVVFHSGDLSGNWLALGNIHLVSHNSFNKIMK